jgi:hypothetical protein
MFSVMSEVWVLTINTLTFKFLIHTLFVTFFYLYRQNVQRVARPISGKFRLDYNLLDELEGHNTLRGPDLVDLDLEELISSDVRLPNIE